MFFWSFAWGCKGWRWTWCVLSSTVNLFLAHVRVDTHCQHFHGHFLTSKSCQLSRFSSGRRSLFYAYFRHCFLSVSPGTLQQRHSQLRCVNRSNTRMQKYLPMSSRLRSFYKNNCKLSQPFQDHGESADGVYAHELNTNPCCRHSWVRLSSSIVRSWPS